MTTSGIGKSNTQHFDLQTPTPNKDGKVGGLMYEKLDKKTGQTILKSAGSDTLSHLQMKAKGYTLMTEKTARAYIQSKVGSMDLPSDLNLKKPMTLRGGTEFVVTADSFMKNINSYQDQDLTVFKISLLMLNEHPKLPSE
jgi:hypothetical protein